MKKLLLVLALLHPLAASAIDLEGYDTIRVFGNDAAIGVYQNYPEYSKGPTFSTLLLLQGYPVINQSRRGEPPIHGQYKDGRWVNGWIDWRAGNLEPVYYFFQNPTKFMPAERDLAIVMFGDSTWVDPDTFELHLKLLLLHVRWMGAEDVLVLTPPPVYERGEFDPIVAENASRMLELGPLYADEVIDVYSEIAKCMSCWMHYFEDNDRYGHIDARGHALIANILLNGD